jgi:hypothetical protein
MTTEKKIKYIDSKLPGLGFDRSHYYYDDSTGAVASRLLDRKIIDKHTYEKLKLIGKKTNFWNNHYRSESLNSQSILWINLVYNILSKNESIK